MGDFRKTEWPLEEWVGSMVVCAKVCQGVVLTSGCFSFGESPYSLVEETPGEEVYDNWVSFIFKQIKGVQTKPLSACFFSRALQFKLTNMPEEHILW